MKKNLFLINIFLFTLFILTQQANANNLLVFVDHTRNLDYYKEGKVYKIKSDIKELVEEYNGSDKNNLLLVEILKENDTHLKAKITISDKSKTLKIKVKDRYKLEQIIKNYAENKPLNFLLLSHTVTNKRLKTFLSYADTNYQLIMLSACKMATPKNLLTMKKYGDFVVASPENIHLAHLEINSLSSMLEGTPLEKGKKIIDMSYARLLTFTKSNLVLNLYDLNKIDKDVCSSNAIDKAIVYKKISLSQFETRKEHNLNFKIHECQ